MIKRLLAITFGAALVLQLDKWWGTRKGRFTPNALTGSLLDKVNERLEEGRRHP
jgi:hypothetical protein